MNITRFAPSPTGYLHIGNLRPALMNFLIARKAGGTFILRIDDTDPERSKQEFIDAIFEDLTWLGLAWDRVEYQSKRLERYEDAAEKMRGMERLYEAFETPTELDLKRKKQLNMGKPPVYDRAGLKQSEEERAAFEAEGRKAHWRFVLPNHDGDPFETRRTDVTWDDLCRGSQSVDLASLSDPVLIRAD
ncbi:MAG: glutamate--tRNA ligase family protein, partial [Planctomycetota bacterium]